MLFFYIDIVYLKMATTRFRKSRKQYKQKQNRTKRTKKYLKRIFGGTELMSYDKNATNNIDVFISKIQEIFDKGDIQQIKVIVGDTKINLNRNKLQDHINYLKDELNKGKSAIIDDTFFTK